MSRGRRKGVSVSHDKRMCGVQQTRCKNAARNSKVWGEGLKLRFPYVCNCLALYIYT